MTDHTDLVHLLRNYGRFFKDNPYYGQAADAIEALQAALDDEQRHADELAIELDKHRWTDNDGRATWCTAWAHGYTNALLARHRERRQ